MKSLIEVIDFVSNNRKFTKVSYWVIYILTLIPITNNLLLLSHLGGYSSVKEINLIKILDSILNGKILVPLFLIWFLHYVFTDTLPSIYYQSLKGDVNKYWAKYMSEIHSILVNLNCIVHFQDKIYRGKNYFIFKRVLQNIDEEFTDTMDRLLTLFVMFLIGILLSILHLYTAVKAGLLLVLLLTVVYLIINLRIIYRVVRVKDRIFDLLLQVIPEEVEIFYQVDR